LRLPCRHMAKRKWSWGTIKWDGVRTPVRRGWKVIWHARRFSLFITKIVKHLQQAWLETVYFWHSYGNLHLIGNTCNNSDIHAGTWPRGIVHGTQSSGSVVVCPSFSSPTEAFHVRCMGISVTPNKSMSCYTQYLLSGQVPTAGTATNWPCFKWKHAWCDQPAKTRY